MERDQHFKVHTNPPRWPPIPCGLGLLIGVHVHFNRSAMMAYGERSPIGSGSFISRLRLTVILNHHSARQEKLLQGLMSEIVRITSQMEPLEVGVPLYPFSKETAFDKPSPTSAPLPSGSPFEDGDDLPKARRISRDGAVNSRSGINVPGPGTTVNLWSTAGDMTSFSTGPGVHRTGYP